MAKLYAGELCLLAPDFAQGVADLTNGRVAFDRLDEEGHEVLVAPCRLANASKQRIDAGLVAPLSQLLQALQLAPGNLFVDAHDRRVRPGAGIVVSVDTD